MPDIEELKRKALQKLGGGKSIASSEASRNINSQQFSNYNTSEVREADSLYAEEIRKQKQQRDRELAEAGVKEEDIDKQSFWNSVFSGAKIVVNEVLGASLSAITLGDSQKEEEFLLDTSTKSTDQIKDEIVSAYNQNKAFDKALKNGVVRNDDFGNLESLEENIPLLDEDDFLDQIKYGLGIEEDKLGNKKLAINLSDKAKYFFYLDKDKDGNDILAKTSIKNHDDIKKTGKAVLNAYGALPVDRGFGREFGAGFSNTYAGLAKNFVNLGRAVTNLASPVIPDAVVNAVTESAEDFRTNYDIQQSQAGVGGTGEWLGSGLGQGASSLAQMAILGTGISKLGSIIAPAASVTDKFAYLTNFGAGSILNFNEAYESALDSGLSEDRAASVGMLTGAINGVIESAIGTNRLVNYLTGGGDRALARTVLNDLNGNVSEASLNRVFNNFKKGLTGDASSFLNRIFETKVLGEATEEGLEELFQTFSQKGVENLYDVFLSGNSREGEGKFGTKLLSKETLKEGLESAFFGALLGAGGGITKVGMDKLSGKKHYSDNDIIPMIVDGKKNDIDAIVKTLHSGRVITDEQKDFYLQRVESLNNLYDSNKGLFQSLDAKEDQTKARSIKSQALGLVNNTFDLSKTNEALSAKLAEVNSNPDLTEVEKTKQAKDLTSEIRNNQLNIKFYNEYLNDNFTAQEDGIIPAYENNYTNNEEIVKNKFDRFILNEDTKDLDRLIENSNSKIQELETSLQTPENLTESPKEIRDQLEREQRALNVYERAKTRNTIDVNDLLNQYNTITSEEYQANYNTPIEQAEEIVTTTPVEAVEEVQVETNTNTQEDIIEAPVNQKASLEQEYAQIEETLNTSEDLDEDSMNQLVERMNQISSDLEDLNTVSTVVQNDYNSYLTENTNRVKAVSTLEDEISEPALSAIKKDIEQTIAGFNSNGVDTTALKQLHANINTQLLNKRETARLAQEEVNRIAEEEKQAKTRDTQTLISNVSFFDRLQRLPFMNSNIEFYTDVEVNNLFQNTPIDQMLAGISLVYTTPEANGYVVGQKLGQFNSTTEIVVPSLFVSLSYNSKKLGNLNQLDGFTQTDVSNFNLTEEAYNNTVSRNSKINALLKSKGTLSPQELADLGFNLNWNGDFVFNQNTPRILVKDFPAAKLSENDNKPYMFDQLRQLEITSGSVDMRENPNVPPIPEGLEDRYLVLLKANNGKFYWVGAQNQVLSDNYLDNLYRDLLSTVSTLKNTTDETQAKEIVSNFNRKLSNEIFVSIPYAQLQLTTPNKTNSDYTLAIKIKGGKGKRVSLDSSKYGTISDLLSELGLDKTNLRTTLADNASAVVSADRLSINTTERVVENPYLYKQITFKFDDSKLNDTLVSSPIVEDIPEPVVNNEESDNPFAGYEINEMDVDSTTTSDEIVLQIGDTIYQDGRPSKIISIDLNEGTLQTKYGRSYVYDILNSDQNIKSLKKQRKNVEPASVPEERTTTDLSQFDPSFSTLDQVTRLRINTEVAPLLVGYDNLNRLQKRGKDVKIRAVINKYKPSNGDPVFSIGTAEEIIDIPQATEWITNNLPSTISVADVNQLLGNIKNNGTTFGAFSNNIIYLNSNAEVGTEYHEAFHAVFRMLLTDKQISVAYNVAKNKYGTPTKSDLDSLRDSSSVYTDYTDTQLSSLWLEEKMADDFKSYANSVNKPSNALNSIWNKIVNWFRFISNNMDEVQALFYNINRGKFKNATIQSNNFNRYANQERVFSIFTKGRDANGNTITTTQLEGQAIVASLTNKLLQAKINRIFPDLSDNEILDKFIEDKAKFYSLDDNPYYGEYLANKGLLDDDNFIDTMARNLEQKRNIFVLPANIAALKKDVNNKAKIFDIDETRNIEDQQAEIDDIGEQFERDAWSIGGETSFSKVLREYISLVTIKTTDEYGQELEEAVDFKKVYRGLVRALASTEEDNILPRFKALAEFDEDINAVFNQLISDLGLTNEGNLDVQNISKNYDLWRKFVTAFNNEKVAWYTILHSSEQSRLIESNNASAKDLQFNEWLQNYSITDEELKFNPELRKVINTNLDFINRSENTVITSFADAKQKSQAIKTAFNKVSIKLSNAYITYSLLKKSVYNELDQESKDYLNSFAGVEGLYDGGNIPFIVSEFKTGYNPFVSSLDDKNKERGAVTRLKQIADQNSLFDPTVGDSSFQNADGKNVYSIIRPSFGLVKLRWLTDANKRQELLNDEKLNKDNFIDPLDTVRLNHLLANDNLDLIMKNLNPSLIDGYRQTNIEGDTNRLDEGEGVTFGKFNAQQYMIADMLMFLSNRKSLNLTNENGKLEKVGESALFNINQMEASNTGYAVFLPVNNYKSISSVTDTLFNYLAQEAIRINQVKNKTANDKTWLGYNDKEGARGYKLMEFSGYGLDVLVDEITGGVTSEEVYNKLLENKDLIVESIKNKLEVDIEAYKQALLSNDIFRNLPKLELVKRGYLKDGENLTDKSITNLTTDFYLNSYINTLGINNLLLDNYSKKVKNTVDWFKRAKGIIGSGPDLGKGITRVAVYKEPVSFVDTKTLTDIDIDKLIANKRLELEAAGLLTNDEINTEVSNFTKELQSGEIKIADAQSYVTLDHKILQLQRWGRYPKQVEDIYNKIKSGLNITWDEVKVLEHNNAALNSTKTVAYNGDYYFKLSELILSPRLVGETDAKGNVIFDDKGNFKPKVGFEYLYNKYQAMLRDGVDQVLPESASKMATIAPAEFAEDGKFDFSKSIMDLENKFKRLQVETPSGKSKIIHGTQLIQLVHSEQDDNLAVDFAYNPDIKNLGELRNLYRQLLADNRLEGFKQALAYIRDPLSGEFNSKELTKKFYDTVVSSGSDEVLSNFFTPDHNGERQFNWNLGPIINKAEQLFLAHFSKGVLSQKVPGLKVALVSDTGIKIKDSKTGKMRSLAHMVKDEDGNYYSECLLPPFANELLGRDPSDKRIQEVLKMFGVRIPTQDKHSMMALKVVGFLPVEYGSVGVFPKQIVLLSGADFDIDSEFIHRADFYTVKGLPIKYGTATTNEGKYDEWVKWNLTNNKLLKSRFKELKASDEIDIPLDNLEDFFAFAENDKKGIITKAFKSLGLPSTLEEFVEQKPINIGVNNNALLEAQIKFLTNDYVRNRAALIPASMDSIKEVAKTVSRELDLNNQTTVSPNTPLARFNANRSNMEGKSGIGPVALANVTHALLSTYDVQFINGITLPEITGRKSTGFGGIYTIGSEDNRKNDNISTLLSAMTDNAKEQLAKLLNLTFNGLPTDTLPVASYMLSVGYTMEETILFLNQPSIRAYVTGDTKLNDKLDTLRNNLKDNTVLPLSIELLTSSLNENNVESISTQDYILQTFLDLQAQAQYMQAVSALLSLNKGLKSTFDDNLRLDRVLKNLQLDFLLPMITDDIESYEQLINKLVDQNIIRKVGNKYLAGEDMYSFVPNGNNINKTPFDARIALLNDPNTIQNIIIHKKVMDSSKEFFLLNTDVIQATTALTTTNSKNIIPFYMDRAYKTYLEEVYPTKYESLNQAHTNAAYMVHKSGANSIGRDLWNLKKDPNFRNNLLIKLLTLKEPARGSSLVSIEFPTRVKAEGDFYTNLNNAFKELFMNPQTTEFARKLYYYSYYKDGLQFRNKSFINTIPSWVFRDVSDSLDLLNEDFKSNNFAEYSSLKNGLVPTVVDMLTSFARVDKLAQQLPKLKLNNRNLFKNTKVSGDTYTIGFKNPELLRFDRLTTYLKSIEDLSEENKLAEDYSVLLKENGGSIAFNIASYFETFSEDPTAAPILNSRIVNSVRGFDLAGNPIELNLNELVDFYLNNRVLPTVYEITYTNNSKLIKESGLNSTIIDNQFIDNYLAIKNSIPKEPIKQDAYQFQEIAENIEQLDEVTQNDINIDFQEEPSSGYRERTIKNASADATIALATDFSSAGEKLTKSSVLNQKKKYIPIDANILEVTEARVNRIVDTLNEIPGLFGISLNIAGNGIYTMKGKYTQDQVDNFTYDLLKQVINSPRLNNKVVSLRSGGQTGFDEAGAKAGVRLGLPTTVLAPKYWKFRNIDGQDISNEQLFKARFAQTKPDNLENPENISIFANPFEEFNLSDDPIELSSEDFDAFEDYQSLVDQSFIDEDILNDFNQDIENMKDDNGDIIC